MPLSELRRNPFYVTTPEWMTAKEADLLFVEDPSVFERLQRVGHAFINGPRGCGKSMMFRFLRPDCQMRRKEQAFADLAFYGMYVPIKETSLRQTELARLDSKHAATIFNEHFMVVYVASRLFSELAAQEFEETRDSLHAMEAFIEESLNPQLVAAGAEAVGSEGSIRESMAAIHSRFLLLHGEVTTYIHRLPFASEPVPYKGALTTYVDFLLPLVVGLMDAPFMPNGPMHLLIDDGDLLSVTQTRILNTWVSTRTSSVISIKISTQLRYPTFQTLYGYPIDTPHDFDEINISTRYTTKQDGYPQRVADIVQRRLAIAGIEKAPDDFFQPDEKQEARIREIAEELKSNWKPGEGGNRPRDDAHRYARANFMRELSGSSKSLASYSYSGFEQLVHLSSAIVRLFLTPASRMYAEAIERCPAGTRPDHITPGVQNSVVRTFSDEYMNELRDHADREEDIPRPDKERLEKLTNLVEAMAGAFGQILLSHASERRIFSFAFSDTPSKEVRDILRLGEQKGVFHVAMIGNKEGTGRVRLYILNRILAPAFHLDATGFAGYQFVTNSAVVSAMANPESFKASIRRRRLSGEDQFDDIFEDEQLVLPFDQE